LKKRAEDKTQKGGLSTGGQVTGYRKMGGANETGKDRVLLVLLAFIGSPVNGEQPIEQRLPQENTGNFKEPDKVVREYYAAYLAFLQNDLNQKSGKVK
jgi:hypothetical protein